MGLINKKGVDVSSNNGAVSMDAIKAAGYDFVMIRCGFGEDITDQDDTQWEENVRKAEAAGLPWGAYFYSYACTEESAKSELAHALRLLKGKRPTMPVAFDMEDADGYKARHGGWNRTNVTRACKIFLEGIAAAGYYPMLYTGFEEIENYINADIVNQYDIWFAHWARSCGYKGKNLSIWQYGGETNLLESNSIAGVGVIDKNLCYKDYPTIIKNGGYNGWRTDAPVTSGLTAAQAMSAARALVGKDENPNECDIMAWYCGFDTDIYAVACCCAGMMYLFFNVLNAGYLIPGGKVADCGSLALNFYNAGQLHKPSEIQPGDLVIFSWSHDRTSVSPLDSLGYMCFEHVELCLEVYDDTIRSVGANNGGTECDDFQIKTRSRADIAACCRPKYAGGDGTAVSSAPTAVSSEAVKEVQSWVNSRYGLGIDVDGIYGSQTRKALTKALQTELNTLYGAGLEVDGIYGPKTKTAVRNLSGGVFSNYIKVLQGFLIGNGYDTGGFDGVFGNATDRAVRQYQRDNSLTVDGIAGRETFEAITERITAY